jgi:hypothetical protein
MQIRILACTAIIVSMPALAEEPVHGIEVMPGHPIYHDTEKEAGVAMALSVAPSVYTQDLAELCEELRVATALASENDGLHIETIFVVPRKDMAVEGYYFPSDGTTDESALVRGSNIARGVLDDIVGRAGIPPSVLDETDVEHEISCSLEEPSWSIAWDDIRPIGDEQPDAVIERARAKFMAVYHRVVEHTRQRRGQGTGLALVDSQRRQ